MSVNETLYVPANVVKKLKTQWFFQYDSYFSGLKYSRTINKSIENRFKMWCILTETFYSVINS